MDREINLDNIQEEAMLNDPHLNVRSYFKDFIKNKSIEELISFDNKLFAEVRNLENEKHILVTQNYKKFVSATETINNIKSSLVGFEDNLLTLQSKVQTLSKDFHTVNDATEKDLMNSENLYEIKKDLKRLKFIKDLPDVLSRQLNAYLADKSETPDLRFLDKSLAYYQKCKRFIKLHKDNSLVKEIYSRTNDLIFKYKNIIEDRLHIPDFSESNLEAFDLCLSLLVKIEDDTSGLIRTFVDRYKYLMGRKFDEIFGMCAGVGEIDFKLYSKIYHNFEFSINETEFLFYEDQIKSSQVEHDEDETAIIQPTNSHEKHLNIQVLSSKYFKRGTFVWVCKKVQETVVNGLLPLAYDYFTKLFCHEANKELEKLLAHVVDLFLKKCRGMLDETRDGLDVNFFREGLMSFCKPLVNWLNKIGDLNLSNDILVRKIYMNNNELLKDYTAKLQLKHAKDITQEISQSVQQLKIEAKFRKELYEDLSKDLYQKYLSQAIERMKVLKKLNVGELLEISDEEEKKQNLNQILAFIRLLFVVLKSANQTRFKGIQANCSMGEVGKKSAIEETLVKEVCKERIYLNILFCKELTDSIGVKTFLEKLLKDHPAVKQTKTLTSELRSVFERETQETMSFLCESFIQHCDVHVTGRLSELFLELDWLSYEKAVSFRLALRDLCYELYILKRELFEVLEQERKHYEETNTSSLNEAFFGSKSQKKMTKYQKEMECLFIRRLSIYTPKYESPQNIIFTVVKIFLKVVNEFVKVKKFSKQAFQQVQLDMNFVKYFFRENLIHDAENIMNGFLLEIMKNCSFNTAEPESFDDTLITAMIDDQRKEFKEFLMKFEDYE